MKHKHPAKRKSLWKPRNRFYLIVLTLRYWWDSSDS